MHAGPRGPQYDFVVYDSQGRLIALVEAKRRFGTSPSWARQWHAGFAKGAGQVTRANVVLVAPDRMYVWRPGADEAANPDWTFEAQRWLAPYFARLKIPVEEVSPHTFEEIVGLWLQDVVLGELPEGARGGNADSLLTPLRGGEVVHQVAA